MRFNKRHLSFLLIVVILSSFLFMFQLPYYIYKPGSADPLTPIVKVEEGYESTGEMHLVTVSGGQATPILYLWAKMSSYHDIWPIEKIRPKEITPEEYTQAQLQMMENSQEAAVVVAYEAAGKDISIVYNGVYVVSVEEGLPAEGKLKTGDLITGIDNIEVKEANDLIDYIGQKDEGDIVQIQYERDEVVKHAKIQLETFQTPDSEEKVGIGIRLVTDRGVLVDPEVEFSSGRIGGPSAGLMFALEIYNQLTEEDLTKGYQIIGTGEIDYEGKVHRIGEVDKKVIAAHRANCDIFFAPYENGSPNSNYELAKKTAEEIGTNMKIVPVDTFEEALAYLQKLQPKNNS